MRTLIMIFIAVSCGINVSAATLEVGNCLTCEYTTIQSAINAASPGDTIGVEEGVYREDIAVNTDSIIITGKNGVVIEGTFEVLDGISTELKIVSVDGLGGSYAIKVKGFLVLKEALVTGAETGVLLAQRGKIKVIDVAITDNSNNEKSEVKQQI